MLTQPNVIHRFYESLVEEIERTAPQYLERAFTVAEIYQSLIPYRTHRDRLGVRINGDYEDALLRLLVGEGDFLLLESEPARARIQKELRSPNPNTGIYREFAAVSVRLNPRTLPVRVAEGAAADSDDADLQGTFGVFGDEADADSGDQAGSVATPVVDRNGGSRPGSTGTAERVEEASEPEAPDEGRSAFDRKSTRGGLRTEKRSAPPESVVEGGSPGEDCPDCESPLPKRDSLRFCPHCGTNVFVVPCRECGEVLERAWRFCVACGTPAKE